MTGLRGVGKTVLLNEIERMAKREGYRTIFIEAHENKSLAALMASYLRTLLFELDRLSGIGNKAKRALAVLKSFIGSLNVTVSDITIGLDIEPEKGSADSGDIEIDLPNLFLTIGEAALDRQSAVAILIDEVQYFNQKELGALIMAMHKIQQRGLPIVLLGAGLPILPGLAGESKSYAERLFNFPEIGALSKEDAAKALKEPARAKGVEFESMALDKIFSDTNGYPYFLQEWGYQTWNLAISSPITLKIVEEATPMVISRLDKNFLRAMAQLGPGPHRLNDVAKVLNAKVSTLSPVRAKLIKKGMIYSPAYGDLDFTVPLFDQFMVRAMPIV